jgi:hypothetical protein
MASSSREISGFGSAVADEAARTSHERGWVGCLDGLLKYVEMS